MRELKELKKCSLCGQRFKPESDPGQKECYRCRVGISGRGEVRVGDQQAPAATNMPRADIAENPIPNLPHDRLKEEAKEEISPKGPRKPTKRRF